MSQTNLELFTTFFVGEDLFGIEVMKVQEVTNTPTIIPVPLAPNFVRGLINLRGQIATAFGLKELFCLEQKKAQEQMSVVCRMDGNLVSLMIDSVGDVVEVDSNSGEPPPNTIPASVRQFVKNVYKMNGTLLSILDLDQLAKELSPNTEDKETTSH